MPFLRFSRDKRGYEHTYLLHAGSKKGAPARLLYWYRTPPGVKVGRIAFDDDVRKALEAQYPSVQFDWARLMETPAPAPDVEHWRERRRLEKAARQARQAAEREEREERALDGEADGSDLDDPDGAGDGDATGAAGGFDGGDADFATVPVVSTRPLPPPPPPRRAAAAPVADAAEAPPAEAGAATEGGAEAARTRKRRRRGGRRRRRPAPGETGGGETGGGDLDQSAPGEDGSAEVTANGSSDADGPDDAEPPESNETN